MSHELQGRQLDDLVRKWLGSADDVRFIEPHQEASAKNSDAPDADFLILKPIPAAIYTMISPSRKNARMRGRRVLASRIALSERFGPLIPVIVIVPDHIQTEMMMFADAVLSVDQLPRLSEMLSSIKLNGQVQRILQEGDPGDVAFSSAERVEKLWPLSLSFADLISPSIVASLGSLAAILRDAILPLKMETEQRRSMGPDFVAPTRVVYPPRSSSSIRPLPPWFLSPRVSDTFENTIATFIEKSCGGEIQYKRFKDPLFPGMISRHIWHGAGGRVAALRRLSSNPAFMAHKSKELISEAWMTRTILKQPELDQVLLLGSSGLSSHLANNPALRIGSDFREKPPRLRDINQLEAAGWKVFPWDFAEDQPAFIRFLKGEKYAL